MSLLSRNQLSIVLAPGQVELRRTAPQFTLRGKAVNVLRQERIPAEAGGDTAWSGALNVLVQALPRFVARDMQASVVLSNHFVQYVLVPWRGNLSEADEIAYATHCFKEIYGDAAREWDIRISPGAPGAPSVASAADSAMLRELRGLLQRMKVKPRSIQPHLMAAVNASSSALRDCSAWFALLEPGSLCLAALQDGQFVWVRKMRIAEAWREELPRLLEREAYLADRAIETDEVFLWAPHLDDVTIRASGRWNIQHLKPADAIRETAGAASSSGAGDAA